MTSLQKVIKYFAIALAVFIIVSIASAILGIFTSISFFSSRKDDSIQSELVEKFREQESQVNTLNMEIGFTNLVIKQGDTLKVETNNDRITCTQKGNTLEIKEKSHKLFSNSKVGELILYVPDNLYFDNVDISTGAGKVNIEELKTKRLDFELGAGKTTISNLNVTEKCDIDGGAGKLDITSGNINNLDLDIGVGESNITSTITGKSSIEAGVGSLSVNLNGGKELYKVDVEKGIGSIRVDGNEASNNSSYGTGENYIKVDGGVGSIKINFAN